jgi:formate dehydrogenase iron-sulfur subunit
MLIDLTRCRGCGECVAACRRAKRLPAAPEKPEELSARALTSVSVHEGVPVRNLCRHCVTPTCASVCPVGALVKTELGPVVHDPSRCIGCRDCMMACPFGIPRFDWSSTSPTVRKCDGCIDLLREGEPPACALACPYGATLAGTRRELLDEAYRRLRETPGGYHDHVYGEREAGGTTVLFLAPRPISALGFPAALGERAIPDLSWSALWRTPGVVAGGGAALFAIWWITRRRNEVAAAEAAAKSAAHARLRAQMTRRKENDRAVD